MESTFSKNLKFLRENLDLKQDALAQKLGISRSVLSYYENGKSEPTLSVLIKLSIFFNISIDNLISIDLTNDNSNISSDFNVNFFSIKNLKSELISKKQYYLNELSTLNKICTIDIPKKLEEIDNLLTLLNNNDLELGKEISPNIIKFPKKETSQYRTINVVGKVSAGNPCYAYEEIIDTIKIPSKYLCSSKNYFVLKISGDSMNKIFDDGTLVLIEQGSFALDSNIVIALIDTESTVKKIKFNTDTIDLIPQSTNPIHKVQTYQKGEVAVLGTVLGPIDKFLLD